MFLYVNILLYFCGMHIKTEVPNYKAVFPNARHEIKYAFSLNDKEGKEYDFYQFENIGNIPCARGFQAITFQQEMNQCVSKEYLDFFVEAAETELNNPTGIRLFELAKLFVQLKERRQALYEFNIAYKLASVIFFHQNENPYISDFLTTNKNADLFREQKMDAFFLSKPIAELIPYISSFNKDLSIYLIQAAEINKKHIKDISTMLSEKTLISEKYKQFILQNTITNLSES